ATGLTREQRRTLADHVTLIPAPRGETSVLLTPFGPSIRPAEVHVLIDADIIVTQPLTGFIEAARTGRIVAFIEPDPTHDRSFQEWAPRLDLPRLRRQPYLNAGQLFVPDSLGRR